ncbi:MAG: class II aldolase/adducin family protein [Anaerolinea sp.]|nr:class II aldolase/adducin family protein [Anaerolinea sp.]
MNILRAHPAQSELLTLRQAIVETGRIAYERGHLTANDGNISTRLPGERILITPAGLCKGRLAPEDLLIVDMNGRLLIPAADPSLRPTSEQPMHLEVYRQRPDVHAVLHAHPAFATALTVANKPLRNDVLPEVIMLLGDIPITDYATPSSQENADVIRELIRTHDALVLRQHGSLTVGRTLDEALITLDRLEHVAKVLALAEMMGQVTPWPLKI